MDLTAPQSLEVTRRSHAEVLATGHNERVTKNYRRTAGTQPVWREWICGENNPHVVIGKDNYFLSADGLLMPARKDQAPPDLRYFNRKK